MPLPEAGASLHRCDCCSTQSVRYSTVIDVGCADGHCVLPTVEIAAIEVLGTVVSASREIEARCRRTVEHLARGAGARAAAALRIRLHGFEVWRRAPTLKLSAATPVRIAPTCASKPARYLGVRSGSSQRARKQGGFPEFLFHRASSDGVLTRLSHQCLVLVQRIHDQLRQAEPRGEGSSRPGPETSSRTGHDGQAGPKGVARSGVRIVGQCVEKQIGQALACQVVAMQGSLSARPGASARRLGPQPPRKDCALPPRSPSTARARSHRTPAGAASRCRIRAGRS